MNANKIKNAFEQKYSTIALLLYDFITIIFSYFFALWLRFDFTFSLIENKYLSVYYKFIIPFTVICLIIYKIFNLYNSIWKYASYIELYNAVLATLICSLICFITIRLCGARMPSSFHVIGFLVQLMFCLLARFSFRFVNLFKQGINNDKKKRVMLIGAGAAGLQIIREINNSDKSNSKIVCIIDDDKKKHGKYIEGIKVVGGREDILYNSEEFNVDEIYFAIPTSRIEEKREILNICKETKCDIKVLPGIYQIANGEVSINLMKDVAIEDLLGRDTIKVNNDEIFDYISNQTVLVTGGGGSIGSELCRQIAKHNPKKLIIFDIYENNAYDIQQELIRNYPELDLEVLIGSVRDSKRVDYLLSKYRPNLVYHAAAHKHVPLMEDSPCEAIKNNTIGTFKLAYASIKYGIKRFVLISTDKAVNPTNIMGASKRMCEMIIQTFDKLTKSNAERKLALVEDCFSETSSESLKSKTEFVAVRFGNVLGSNGSVVPLFKKQIENGGPVTVTHPDIIRYFMTIPEAVSLVLQAGAYANGGEIFVLDMGDPVKIDLLAKNLIKLSGFTPNEDIKIVYTGLRPGEKLYEEKLLVGEGDLKTDNELIYIAKPLDFDEDVFLQNIKSIYYCSINNDVEKTKQLASEIVETYKISN